MCASQYNDNYDCNCDCDGEAPQVPTKGLGGAHEASSGGRCERNKHTSASEASMLAWETLPFFTWHFLQQSGQFLRLSGQARSEAEGGPTASKLDHFTEGGQAGRECRARGESVREAPKAPTKGQGGAREAPSGGAVRAKRARESRRALSPCPALSPGLTPFSKMDNF